MAGQINPRTLRWRHDGKNVDGSAFDSARFAGWELELNGKPSVSVPVGWLTEGQYAAPIADLELPEGDYSARLRLVTTTEGIASDWSGPVTFITRKVPSRPLDFGVE